MKLNQLIALVAGKKPRVQQALNYAKSVFQQRAEVFGGLIRTYTPLDDEGEKLPDESKLVQLEVRETLKTATEEWADLINLVNQQDEANNTANGDIVVDGQDLYLGVPVTTLMYLEKQLKALLEVIGSIPVLDSSSEWNWNEREGLFETPVRKAMRTKKVLKSKVLYDATPEHPAQVETYTEDEQVGEWSIRGLSSAIPAKEKREMYDRVLKLIDAVKTAREEANSDNADGKSELGDKLVNYIVG